MSSFFEGDVRKGRVESFFLLLYFQEIYCQLIFFFFFVILFFMQNFGESVYIGIDLGSSFVKVCIVDQNQNTIKSVRVPQHELQINSPNLGWAQQDPEKWWQVVKQGLNLALNDENINKSKIKGIGISYQMHGLVMVDKEMNVIRPAIIWCDGRATKIGKQLFEKLKERKVDHILLNHPSNFTLVKLLWVKQNQPENYAKIYKIMLPGDFIAMKLSGEIKTTKLGLSQGTFWDYPNDSPCYKILNFLGISQSILPELVENFTSQSLTAITNILPQNIPIYYRSGDQPNNAFSLNVMNPGQIAATGGTSGVIYAISNKNQCKEILKFNSFFHVNHCAQNVRIGKLLCISGCGSVYRWVRDNFCAGLSYEQMNEMAELCQSDGVVVIPFGNGPERMLNNDQVGCHVLNINFMNHKLGNIIRGCLQGIAFSFVYGANLLRSEKIQITTMKAGKGNIFESSLFCQILSNALNVSIQLYETSGAQGAAKAAIMGQRQSKQNKKEIDFSTSPTMIHKFTPNQEQVNKYKTLYENWQQHLKSLQGQIKA